MENKEEILGIISGHLVIALGHLCDKEGKEIDDKATYQHIANGNSGFFRKITIEQMTERQVDWQKLKEEYKKDMQAEIMLTNESFNWLKSRLSSVPSVDKK